ncbi:MAG: phytanoyl-CoA dioxygenase family protein [Armatimonadota bacterium]|nr:phytanoyl-CoA dioxygenase family protein [bacterium]MDW8322400.1 phytanoyl-CoA dioxygenase family protein [Armatimonadota bacterium]
MTYITDEQWCEYFKNGYLRLGKVMSDEELDQMRQRIDDIMLGRANIDYDRLLMQLDSETGRYEDAPEQTLGFKGATLNYRKIQNLEYDPVFLRYMQKPLFREICATVYGAHAPIACYRAMFMNKPAQKGTVLPWHQDAGLQWGLDRDPVVTIWTALDPATKENGCVRVVPGTHRLGLLSEWGHTITPEQEAMYCPEDKVVYLEAEAGEAILLHNWLLHGSGVNTIDIPRRAFSVCYMDGRTRRLSDGGTFPIVFGKGALSPEELEAGALAVSSHANR